ncbi:MAG TPA: hypothetical protein VGP08_03195 [Pyrinomonadaceae bacterium]|jgi:ppGpp synthetase/RelA/SpoT-type nucleotidyltranferase|nr:hypothetical protein [Pyrinomonadaceae bacterium]
MSENRYDGLKDWHGEQYSHYKELGERVKQLIETLMEGRIERLSITCRPKEWEKFEEKVRRKRYKDPRREVTDFAAVRVITYVESEVAETCKLIERTFNVHRDKSVDKSDELGVDRVGYRSVHFICDLDADRLKLPEFSKFEGMLFEVQVRTILQHAWAQIHHERDYKFSGILPRHIRRRLYRLAAVLELVDSEFDTLAFKLDQYTAEVSESISRGDLGGIEINTTSLSKYLPVKLGPLKERGLEVFEDDIPQPVIEELGHYGVQRLSELDSLVSEDLLNSVASHESYTTYAGLLRDSMLYDDIERYFAEAWNNNWQTAESYTFEVLSDKYGGERVERIFQERGIEWN